MTRLLFCMMMMVSALAADGQTTVAGAMQSYNDSSKGKARKIQYHPYGDAFICENGTNRFTRALYGGWTDYRIETSDRPIFAIAKKGQHKSVRFEVAGMPIEDASYCWSSYQDGMRIYVLSDERLKSVSPVGVLRVKVVALHEEEGAVWQFIADDSNSDLRVKVKICDIANPKMKRNGDIGADKPGVFEPAPDQSGLTEHEGSCIRNFAHVVIKGSEFFRMADCPAFSLFNDAVSYNQQFAKQVVFQTPNAYINTLGSALVFAADGDWDGQTWLHGCIGWRMPLAGWRAAYVGDVIGWNDRAVSHFDAYSKSQVTDVAPTVPHPSQDPAMNMARAEKKWGTQMYSNGYICRNPEKNDQMHHYDMNLNFIDELLWHFQYDADTEYMRKMWPVITSHLAWEKRNYDPDGDHLYDAYCCIWASDALYYSGGAVTHSSAYNYRGNLLAARIAELIGENPQPYREEAEAILNAMNERLWLPEKGVWAEYQETLGLKRKHDHPAVWSIYTPIDCGACSPEQAWKATEYVEGHIPHIDVEHTGYRTISTSDWMPYSWSINNVACAEVMHTALAFFEAGRNREGYELMMANILDNMYYGQSPANFGQLSHYDAARGECYRDFGDCIGISSRTLIQGLYGIVPEALYGRCIIRPGFPAEWNDVAIKTPYIYYRYTRVGQKIQIEVSQNFCQPLKIVYRQHLGNGKWRDIEGTSEQYQVIEVDDVNPHNGVSSERVLYLTEDKPQKELHRLGLEEPVTDKKFRMQDISENFNAEVDDIFKNKYLSPRPNTTTLQIPVQGVGEWCHPQHTPAINDSVFRTLISGGEFVVAGVPFKTPKDGKNIVYTSLWDNYPNAVTLHIKKAKKHASAYLLMAGSTNHMQCHIDNGIVVATYKDCSSDTLRLRNPENWCPIEQDYYVDSLAFCTIEPRPYRVALGTGTVSRDLGKALNIKGVYGREIPGGAAQMLRMPLDADKKVKSITVQTLSNDVVIGLMAVTLQ